MKRIVRALRVLAIPGFGLAAPALDPLLGAQGAGAPTVEVLHQFFNEADSVPHGPLVQAADGSFYGAMTGGTFNQGGVGAGFGNFYRFDPSSGALRSLHTFDNSSGATPAGGLVQGPDGAFYGLRYPGEGPTDWGTVYKIDSAGKVTTLHTFDSTDGEWPWGSLVAGGDGSFYGVTIGGHCVLSDPNNFGSIFRITPSGTFTLLHTFNPLAEQGYCVNNLIAGEDGNFYGTTLKTGFRNPFLPTDNGNGVVFRITPKGVYTVLHRFRDDEGAGPDGVVYGSDGALYGVTGTDFLLGSWQYGILFRIQPRGLKFEILHRFGSTPGSSEITASYGQLVEGDDGRFYGLAATTEAGAIFRIDTAGTYETLHNFHPEDGFRSVESLTKGRDGAFYGVTYGLGRSFIAPGEGGPGTIFRIDTAGNFTTLHSFINQDGSGPNGTLVRGSDGAFYGVTRGHPRNLFNLGSVFRIDPSGSLTTLHLFNAFDGAFPEGRLVSGEGGDLFGVTEDFAFPNGFLSQDGEIFKINLLGDFTVLHRFNHFTGVAGPSDLTAGGDGNLYGTAPQSVFRMDSGGNVTTVHTFSPDIDGSVPSGGLVLGNDGLFYGRTAGCQRCHFPGTAFKMDLAGDVRTLHTFDPDDPPLVGRLAQGGDGAFYGMISYGGAGGFGTAFRMDALGNFTALHSFAGPDGAYPSSELLPASDGYLYGMTERGGTLGYGTIFRLSPSGDFAVVHSFNLDDGALPFNSGLLEVRPGEFLGTTRFGGNGDGGVVFRLTVPSR